MSRMYLGNDRPQDRTGLIIVGSERHTNREASFRGILNSIFLASLPSEPQKLYDLLLGRSSLD
jgi:hypothetical protein